MRKDLEFLKHSDSKMEAEILRELYKNIEGFQITNKMMKTSTISCCLHKTLEELGVNTSISFIEDSEIGKELYNIRKIHGFSGKSPSVPNSSLKNMTVDFVLSRKDKVIILELNPPYTHREERVLIKDFLKKFLLKREHRSFYSFDSVETFKNFILPKVLLELCEEP